MPRLAWVALLVLAGPTANAARCDGEAAAQPVRERLARGELIEGLKDAEAAARKCPASAIWLAVADAAAELWLRDRAVAAYRRAAVLAGADGEGKEQARRGLEAALAISRTPRLDDLVRDAAEKQRADPAQGIRLWQRAITQAEAARVATPPVVWSGHAEPIDAVAWGDKLLATGSRDKTIKLWDVESGRGLATLTGHADRVTALAFSPDGRRLASAAADRTVRLWDVATGRELRASPAQKNVVSALAFSPDGKRLATGGWDARVKLWDVDSGLELATLAGHGDSIVQLSFTRDGACLASVSRDGGLRVWDASAARLVATKLPQKKVAAAVFLADGTLAIAQPDGVQRWALPGKPVKRYSSEPTSWLWVDARGLLLGAGGRDVAVIDLSDGRTVRRFGIAAGAAMALAPDGARLLWARGDRDAFVSDAGGLVVLTLGSIARPVTALGWLGTTLVVGMEEDRVVTWDPNSPPATPTFRTPGTLVAVLKDALLRRGKKAPEVVELNGTPRATRELVGCYDPAEVRGALSLASGELVLAYRHPPCGDRAVHVWARASQAPALVGPRDGVRAVAPGPDGRSVVAVAVVRPAALARPEAELGLWNLSGGEARITRRIPVEPTALAVSRSGVLATGGRTIAFWRATTLTRLRSLPTTSSPATALAFSPDGRFLASGHADGTTVFWDVSSGHRRGVLVVAGDGTWAYASEDGRMDGTGSLISLQVAGATAPPGLARSRVAGLNPRK